MIFLESLLQVNCIQEGCVLCKAALWLLKFFWADRGAAAAAKQIELKLDKKRAFVHFFHSWLELERGIKLLALENSVLYKSRQSNV